jgi:NAD(P)H-quinone oxidoreductase subunit 5
LLAAILMHHLQGEGNFDDLMRGGVWPEGHAVVAGTPVLGVGLLLLLAAAGKSALVPFSGWLPRAMEGPTPSSAVFYGALSVHLGAYLLLRVSPLLETSVWLSALVLSLGLATACYAYLIGSVQTDIKSALSFASLVQVGLIVAEIGLGFRYLALAHLLGNACLRTLQFIRAPSLLQDYHRLENAIGDQLPRLPGPFRLAPPRLQVWLFRFALERGYLDALLLRYLVTPFRRLFTTFDSWERRWTDWLTGRPSRELSHLPTPRASIEELS